MINYLSPDFSDLPGRRRPCRMYQPDVNVDVSDAIDVSIITPYYNTEAFFVETFASLQAQSLQNWEWVIVDDGSTDKQAIERLAQIERADKRITVLRQANAGPAAARNKAFRNTKGRYVCLLDSDDMVEPTYLEKCVWFLDSNPNFAFCNSYSVIFGDEERLWRTGFETGKAHLQANSGPPISVIRRSAYSECGGFDESIRFGHEDWDFWLAMAKAGFWGYTIPEFLQWYRKRGNGRFEQIMKTAGVHENFQALMLRKYGVLEKNFPHITRRHIQPYETIQTTALVHNPLTQNLVGRRVMFLIPWMVTGGADRVNLDLIEGLTSNGHDVTVCATLAADHRWEHEFARFTPDIFVLPNFLHATDYPRFLAYLIQSRKIDTVVISGSTIGYQLLPYLRAVAPHVAFVDMCHVEEPQWLNGGHPRFAVGYQDLLDLNITTTKNLAEWMHGRGADAAKIRVMYTGVRASNVTRKSNDAVRARLGIPVGIPVIVFAGRICEQKRPFLLAQILRNVHQEGIDFRALVIGDGELRGDFEKLIGAYKLTAKVLTLGFVAHSYWLEILSACDILLMPSQYEGISIALLEAMAAGVVPVVAHVGGHDEIVHPDAGVLIGHGENELYEYVQAIRDLLSHPSSLRKMSDECFATINRQMSWETMNSRFVSILDEAHEVHRNSQRNVLTARFALELTSQALECKRLGEAVDWIWTSRANEEPPNVEAKAVAKIAIGLSRTWLGRRLIWNRCVRAIGRFALRRVG